MAATTRELLVIYIVFPPIQTSHSRKERGENDVRV